MFRADPAHSSTAAQGPSNLTIAWKFTTDGSVISSPAVVNGIVYAGSQDKNVYALDAYSGKLIWKYATGGSIEDSPAIADGMLYIESDDGYLYCLNAQTGALNWQTSVGSNLDFTYANLMLTSSPVVSGGIVYIGSLDGNLYALTRTQVQWCGKLLRVDPSSVLQRTPTAPSTSLPSSPQQACSTNWTLPLGTWRGTSLFPICTRSSAAQRCLDPRAVAAGMVFASSDFGAYYAVNAETGELVWDFINTRATEFIVSSPIYEDGNLYILDIFNIVCLNAANGHELWSAYTGDELYVSPSYADGKIYMATSERHILILDTTKNGERIATGYTPSSSWSSPAIANGMLYIGCNDWNIYCFTEGITQATFNHHFIRQRCHWT